MKDFDLAQVRAVMCLTCESKLKDKDIQERPEMIPGKTYKIPSPHPDEGNIYVTVNRRHNQVWELFCDIGKESPQSTVAMIVIARLCAKLLQRGYPIEKLIKILSGHISGGMVHWRKYYIRSIPGAIAAVLMEETK